jgi:hypothetical protein
MTNTFARFEYDPTEQYAAARAVTRATNWRWIIPVGAIGIPLFVIAVTILPHLDTMSPTSMIISSLPWILLGAFYLVLIPMSQKRRAKKLPTREPSVRGTQERGVDEAGLHIRGHGLTMDYAWPDLQSAVETPQFFLFFYNKNCAHFIPKRALPASGLDDVRTVLRTYMGSRAKLAGGSTRPLANER